MTTITMTEEVSIITFAEIPYESESSFICSVFSAAARENVVIDMISKAPVSAESTSIGFTFKDSDMLSLTLPGGEQVTLIVSIWEKAGIHASVAEMSDEDFMARRKSGSLACYTSTWSADFNDPDNFIYTFFGTLNNTLSRRAKPDNMRLESAFRINIF